MKNSDIDHQDNTDLEEQYYEERRRERHERILRRKKRQRRKRILALVITVLILLCSVGFIFGDRIGISHITDSVENLVSGIRNFLPGNAGSDSSEEEIMEVISEGGSSADNAEGTGADETGEVTADSETADASQITDGSETADSSEGTDNPDAVENDGTQAVRTASGNWMPQGAAAGAGFIRRQLRHEKKVLTTAKAKAAQYDYDGAIRLLQKDNAYVYNVHFQKAAEKFQKKKDKCVAWSPDQVTHIFYHSLIVDTSKAFDGDYKTDGYNQVMTTMDEFNKITQKMYDKGYVMVNLYDLAGLDENGNMKAKTIYLPKGKIPFVLSQDDVCYYHSQDGDGIATKLVIDEEGKVRNEYVQDDGSTVIGDYDVVPLIDRFVEEHPDFAYHGHKGIVALTGYNGILGYRTDISYQTRPDDLNDDKKAWLEEHPDFNLETERAGAKQVADAMKAEGWTFASHTWGHKNMSTISMERLITDTENFKENVDPLIGGTDIIIFAFGADINTGGEYTGDEKFDYLKSQGYDYYCNVDSNRYFVQITDQYFRMGRRNVDGYRMYYNPDLLSDLFDASLVFDPSRPTPVPPMNGD